MWRVGKVRGDCAEGMGRHNLCVVCEFAQARDPEVLSMSRWSGDGARTFQLLR